jgi:hypothetical protein
MASLRKKLRKLFGKERKQEGYYWEYYNRINLIAQEIRALGMQQCRVLDVGGIKSNNIIKQFGIDNVTTLNITGDADITASAHKIPFDDRSFDIVCCTDTLEHIPRNMRDDVVNELIRLAKIAVFIIAPIDNEENRRAEALVQRYLPTSGYLKDHFEHGLVDFDHIRTMMAKGDQSRLIKTIKEVDLDNLMFWVLAMIGDKENISRLYQELYFLENRYCPRRKALLVYKI